MISIKNVGRLIKNDRLQSGNGFGGIFVLPPEFNSNALASRYVEKNEVQQVRQNEPVIGTEYSAPGWEVWKFPKFLPKADGTEYSEDETKIPHDKADKPYEVFSGGKTYVLVFRDAEISAQVSELYAQLSREKLEIEINESPTAAGQGAVIPSSDLPRDRALEAEMREDEALRKEAAANTKSPVKNLLSSQRQPQKLSR